MRRAPEPRAIDDAMTQRSLRRRRRVVWLLVAAALLTSLTMILPLVFGAEAVIRALHLRRVRGVIRRYPWRAVELESQSPLFDFVEPDHLYTRRRFRSPRRFVGEVAGPVRTSVIDGGYSVVRELGSDRIHLVRGCIGNEVDHQRAALIDDVTRVLPSEIAPPVRCELSDSGLEALTDGASWLTVLATKTALWDSTGEQIGRITRKDLDFALLDKHDAFVAGRDRRFMDDVFWCDAGDRGVGRRRAIRLIGVSLRRIGRRWPSLQADDGTVVATTTRTPLHRWWRKSAAIAISTDLEPLDRALVVLHLAVELGLAPRTGQPVR